MISVYTAAEKLLAALDGVVIRDGCPVCKFLDSHKSQCELETLREAIPKPRAPTPWTYEFDEYGGYDCMSAAYTIRDADGEDIFFIECENTNHTPDPEALSVVTRIVNAVNKG